MGKEHIIELNGQRYDARTGAIVTATPMPPSKKPARTPSTARTMDGFSRAPKHALPHRQPEKSKTLMRTVVSKPITPPTHHTPAVHPLVKPSPSATHSLTKHATNVPKSPLVDHFRRDVVSAPHHVKAVEHPHVSNPLISSTAAKSSDPVHTALAIANSHQQPKHKKPRLSGRVARRLKVSPRVVSGASFAFAFLLIGGFFAYQNIPGLTMRLAAARSGVHGKLPSYQPAGFSLNGSIAYQPGQITINYKSNSDNRNFKVSQSSSQWDSQSLLENYVALNRRDYQTVQDKGKTVYIYDDSNATWVDGGIWYRVEGDSNLNSDQLLHIAASL